MKNYYFDEKLLFWWKIIILIKIYHSAENLSQLWKFITVMKIITKFIKLRVRDLLMNLINLMDTVLEIYHPGEKLIIWQKLIYLMKVHHWDENGSLW